MTDNRRQKLALMGFVFCIGLRAAAGPMIVFNDNGGWCWYQDERIIVQNDKLIIGSIANAAGTGGSARSGDVEVTTYDITAGTAVRSTLYDNFQADDHNTAAFLPLPDGRVLAMYSKHGSDALIRYRITVNPYNTTSWNPEVQLTRGAGVTYSNIFRLSAENGGSGRIYNFYRGENYNPNFVISNNNGAAWSYGGWLIRKDGHRPYVKYASNNVDRIYFITTEGHPRDYNNSIYIGYIYGGGLYKIDGTKLRDITTTAAAAPEDLTKVYQGGASNVAWTTDIHLDADGNPYFAFSIQVAPDGSDLRYYYARWNGSQMFVYEIAYAGSRLYSAESDYTGLVALDPQNPNVLYISTNANPLTGAALISNADGQRRYEIFRGTTANGGASWTWEYITKNSTVDNIRPVVPIWDDPRTILLWMRGTYSTYTNYNTQIVGMFDPQAITPDAPEITDQPDSAAAPLGGNALFNIQATGLAPLNYTWYKVDSGGDIQVGENSNRLILTDMQASDFGRYYCIVANSAGSAMSSLANLMVADLTAWWPLDGNYTDATGHGYNASAAGSPAFTAGHLGQSVNLNGSSYLNCANSSVLTLKNGGTISAWVKTASLANAWASVVTKGRYAWRLCRNNQTSAVVFHFSYSTAGEYQANGKITVVDNTWHHLAATYDGQSIKLYVDGILDASAATTGPVNELTDPVWIGSRTDNPTGRSWNGQIDEVRIYSFAMDAATVGLLYQDKSCYRLDPYDLTADCRINLDDAILFAADWLDSGIEPQTQVCTANPDLDLTGPQNQPDCRVDIYELADLASRWMDCFRLPDTDCL